MDTTETVSTVQANEHDYWRRPTDDYYHFLSNAWAWMQFSTAVFGIQLYWQYPWAINNDTYWKQTCPNGTPITQSVTGKEAVYAANN